MFISSLATTRPCRLHHAAGCLPDLPAYKTDAVRAFERANRSCLMSRVPHCLTLLAGAAILLAQPVLAQAHTAHSHHVAYRHHHVATVAYSHQRVRATLDTIARSPFYGPFGGYYETAAAAHYRGRNERHYYGYGPAYADGGYAPGPSFAPAAERRFDSRAAQRSQLEGLVEQQASANGIPASLVHRVIMRESGYNPRAVSAGNYGLMQIRLGTARAMGYTGSAAGLLDAQTNMTYAVRYLAGAYRAAGGNEARAVALYARGYNAPRYQEASFGGGSFGASNGSFGSTAFFQPAVTRGNPTAHRYSANAWTSEGSRGVYRGRYARHRAI
jgi:hypothetical protein